MRGLFVLAMQKRVHGQSDAIFSATAMKMQG